jgi:anti-anti-sigma regulatory factor
MEVRMRFAMADRGSVFSTRDRAIRLLSELERAQAAAGEDRELILDFDGVVHVGDSFADEFVAAIVAKRRSEGLPDVQLVNMCAFVEKVVQRAISARQLDLVVAA